MQGADRRNFFVTGAISVLLYEVRQKIHDSFCACKTPLCVPPLYSVAIKAESQVKGKVWRFNAMHDRVLLHVEDEI